MYFSIDIIVADRYSLSIFLYSSFYKLYLVCLFRIFVSCCRWLELSQFCYNLIINCCYEYQVKSGTDICRTYTSLTNGRDVYLLCVEISHVSSAGQQLDLIITAAIEL